MAEPRSSGVVTFLSVIGLTFGLISLLSSFLPLIGTFAFLIGIPAAVFCVLALIVSYFQNAKRTFAIVALTVSLLGIFLSYTQKFSLIYLFGPHKNYGGNAAINYKEMSYSRAYEILREVNANYNSKQFTKIANIYRPNGNVLSPSEIKKYIEEANIFFNRAGKILQSEILSINGNENQFKLIMRTTYEKLGTLEETFVFRKEGKEYTIIQMV